ncbi:unnamed protein product [Rotaria socialis]|uniref:Uncharacterized protein n=1 Tax=Rotaria socialis TaxID=392032 RepID=A0A818QBV3_9BILA|nr:unnamed protein product [Rotaria socialis]CAF4490533.1 unnamed protein product [Rotaria socialis]
MIIIVLITLPIYVHSLILIPPNQISEPRNITCYSPMAPMTVSDFQLCVFRVYTNVGERVQLMEFAVRDGVWYTNTFRQLLKRCHGFSTNSDVGIATCSPLPYETFQNMTICICGESHCNIDLVTCKNWNMKNAPLPPMNTVLKDLSNTVNCSGLEERSVLPRLCTEHPFINVSKCLDYVRSNAILCSINIVENIIRQEALVADNYERAMIEQCRAVRYNGHVRAFNFTKTFAFFLHVSPISTNEVCFCNTYQNCNINTRSCKSLTPESTTTRTTSIFTFTSTMSSAMVTVPRSTTTIESSRSVASELPIIGTMSSTMVTAPRSTTTIGSPRSVVPELPTIAVVTAATEISVKLINSTQGQQFLHDILRLFLYRLFLVNLAQQSSLRTATTAGIIFAIALLASIIVIIIVIASILKLRVSNSDARGNYHAVPTEAELT